MKPNVLTAFTVICILICAPSLMAQNRPPLAQSEAYIIGPGDVLEISVWKDEVMDKIVTVLPDGKISFPLIGQVVAEGKTVDQLTKELKKKISKFVPRPVLTVTVRQVNSLEIYVLGRVNRPSQFVLDKNINVLQALTMAGGLDRFASRGKIKIFRKIKDTTHIFDFSYDDVTKGKHLNQNIQLKRGDVIVVP